MSLREVRLISVVKSQYKYKLKAYSSSFISLMILQLVALFFSFNGAGMSGRGMGDVHLTTDYYSADIVIMFMYIWAFITGIIVTTRANWNDDFLYVSTRQSSHLANVLFLLSASAFAGITAILSSFLLKILVILFTNKLVMPGGLSLIVAPKEVLMGMIVTSAYFFMFAMIGYFIGVLVQLSRILIVLIPALFIGELVMNGFILGKLGYTVSFFMIFFSESSLFLFILKIIGITALLFIISSVLSNRLEVR